MAEHRSRIRRIDPSELLPEEVVLQKDPNDPFMSPGERPEPYRTQYIAYEQLQPLLRKEQLSSSPLVVQTPRGKGLLWRWWPDSLGIVLIRQMGDEWAIEDTVTFLEPSEQKQVTVDLTMIVLNPPRWH